MGLNFDVMRSLRWLWGFLAAASSLHAQSASFQPSFQEAEYSTGCPSNDTSSNHIAVGDFNGDGKADIAISCGSGTQVSNTFGIGTQITILLGNGDGTFQAPVVTSIANTTLNQPSSLLAADLNGDGKTDLIFSSENGPQITANICGGIGSGRSWTVVELLSQGNGTFAPPGTVATGLTYTAQALADVDGDGIPDLVLDSDGQLGVGVMLGKKDGTFSALTPVAGPSNQCWAFAAITDLNGDGKPDLVIRNQITSQSSALSVMLNQGGSFGTPALLTNLNDNLAQVLSGDFNGDGKPDLGVRTEPLTSESDALQIFLGNGDGTFQAPKPSFSVFASALLVLDLNGDGKSDLSQGGVIFYLSNGDGIFQRVARNSKESGVGGGLAADFNGDGKPDIVGFLGRANDTMGVLINTTIIAATTGAANGASFVPNEPLTAGALASVFGNGFATSDVYASAIPLPQTLGGLSVTIGGFPAPLLFVSSKQINLQVPWEISGPTADIVVTVNGTALAPFHASIGPVSPGVFTTQSGTGQAIAINPDGSLAGPEGSIPGTTLHPAKAGDALVILATGLGPVTPTVSDGDNSSDTLRNTVAMPTVLIGGEPAEVQFSGLSPQFVGLNQINVTVPQVKTGVVSLRLSIGGITTSNQVIIAVQ